MIKRCARCGKEFDRSPRAKYCWDCVVEVRNENQRRWIETHYEQFCETQRKYRKAHREQIRERARQRRLRKKLEREAAK